ncbi:MAG: SRPBCC family protein [Gaiellaceae bacterium]
MNAGVAHDGSRATLSLLVGRFVAASPDLVFNAWTQPDLLERWWGPKEISCSEAQVDLRVGGRYRLANRDPEGAVLWITGIFEAVERPHRLVYTWAHEPVDESTEYTRVTVRFEAADGGTEVTLVHELLPSQESKATHAAGWHGCLDGLATLFDAPAS